MNVTARITRSGDWWAIEVPEVPGTFSQTKRLDQVATMAAEAAALLLDIDPEEIDVTLDLVLPDELQVIVAEAKEASARAQEAQAEASELTRSAVAELRAAHLSMRDVAVATGVSFQRVSQLEGSMRTTVSYESGDEAAAVGRTVASRRKGKSSSVTGRESARHKV